jgi:signal transduction histidine kinase
MTWLSYIREGFSRFTFPENLGRWALSWQFWAAIAPFRLAIIDQRFLRHHENYWTQLFPVLILGILSSGVPLFIASVTYLKDRFTGKPKVGLISLTWFLSDLLQSLTINFLLGSQNLRNARVENPFNIVFHAAASIPFGATILIAWCVIFLARDRSAQLRLSLENQRGLLENLDEYYEVVRAKLSEQVSESIVPGFARIKSEVAELTSAKILKGKYLDFAERVRNFSLRDVRELSHRIAVDNVETFERKDIDPAAIIDNTRLSGAVLTPASPILACLFFFATQPVVNPEESIWLLSLETVVLWCSTDVVLKFYKLFSHLSLSARLPLLALALFAPVASVAATFVGLTQNTEVRSISIFTFCVVVMSALVAYPYRYFNELEIRLTKAEQTIEETKESLRTASESVRESFSRVIHGKIQGRLALVSFLLGQFGSGEVKPRDKASHLAKLQELLNRIDEELQNLLQPVSPVTLADTVSELSNDWAGLLALQLDIEPEALAVLKANPSLEHTLSNLVEESILNARLHGNAHQAIVWVRLLNPQRLHLIVADNGLGELLDNEPGLGKAMLSASSESWSLERSEAGHTVLSAVMVVEP